MKWISFFAIWSAVFINAAFSVYKPKVIYGEDNRVDLYSVKDQTLVKVAQSTSALFTRSSLVKDGNVFNLMTRNYGEVYKLCQGEPFANQPSGAMCSGFLVGEDLIATAGHCITSADCDQKAFVFGFAMRSENSAPQSIPEENVYFCQSVVKREYTRQQDYALVKLDRPVRGREPLKLSSQAPQLNDPLVVIGHPAGIPTKLSGGAFVRAQLSSHFVANLDTYGGNSGSAVFNAETLEVLGILVRGETDFQFNYDGNCYQSNVCEMMNCRGEDVTNIRYISQAMQSL